MTCVEIEPRLAPYADGVASPADAAEVERHIATCAMCRDAVRIQQGARALVAGRRAALATSAPPGLQTRLAALMRDQSRPVAGVAWLTPAARLAAAVVGVVAVGMLFELVSPRPNALYAAQLAIDHMRCLVFKAGSTTTPDPDSLATVISKAHGATLPVPGSDPDTGLTLMAARRCPLGIGPHAHLIYSAGGRPVSLYITPNQTHRAQNLNLLGHAERLWTFGGHTYAMVARDLPAESADRIAAYLRRATEK